MTTIKFTRQDIIAGAMSQALGLTFHISCLELFDLGIVGALVSSVVAVVLFHLIPQMVLLDSWLNREIRQ